MHRRHFLKTSGIAALPTLGTAIPFSALAAGHHPAGEPRALYFFGDGTRYNTTEFIDKLQQLNNAAAVEPDFYGAGGVVEALEKR